MRELGGEKSFQKKERVDLQTSNEKPAFSFFELACYPWFHPIRWMNVLFCNGILCFYGMRSQKLKKKGGEKVFYEI